MDTLHITTPADLVSRLGYWPHESLVCISLQDSRMGATLRLDLPSTPDHAHMYARKVCGYLRSDQDATAAVFAIFTDTTRDNAVLRGRLIADMCGLDIPIISANPTRRRTGTG